MAKREGRAGGVIREENGKKPARPDSEVSRVLVYAKGLKDLALLLSVGIAQNFSGMDGARSGKRKVGAPPLL
jgi:hypothetical protein